MKWNKKYTIRVSIVTVIIIAIIKLLIESNHIAKYLDLEDARLPTRDNSALRINETNNDEYGIGHVHTTEDIGIIPALKDDNTDDDNDNDKQIDNTEENGIIPTLKDDNEDDDNDNAIQIDKDRNILAIDIKDAQTGSFSNCTDSQRQQETTIGDPHPDSGTLTVSCGTIRYRVPIHSFNTITSPIIVGVLSNAGDNGPVRRNTIRETWAKDQPGVFFLVAGRWEAISDEYKEYSDLIWINKEEIYNREHSVLQMKTLSFLSILYTLSEKIPTLSYSYAFKTDDDSYVDIHALHTTLNTTTPDYWGHCSPIKHEPKRGAEYKWSISFADYPYPYFPQYCQGAGYALSRAFVDCATAGEHIGHLLPIPFEDAAVGMLAERCHIDVPDVENKNQLVKLHRHTSKWAKQHIALGKSQEHLLASPVCMTEKVLQHRIINEVDMRNHYRTVLDPSYCDVMAEKFLVEQKAFLRKQRKRKKKNMQKHKDINDDNNDVDSNN